MSCSLTKKPTWLSTVLTISAIWSKYTFEVTEFDVLYVGSTHCFPLMSLSASQLPTEQCLSLSQTIKLTK